MAPVAGVVEMPSNQTTHQTLHDGHSSASACTGLYFDVARDVEDVLQAWELVYLSYHRTGLIDPNIHRVHLVPQAVHPDSAVIIGRIQTLVVSTMTVMADRPGGLPLDAVYPRHLDKLRGLGRTVAEFGLFADRREHLYRSAEALLELMRHATWLAVHGGATDAIIGVHPRHAPFYARVLGFDIISDVKTHPTVNHAPVTLLHLDWYRRIAENSLPRGLAHLIANPVQPDIYEKRARLTHDAVRGTAVGRFLQSHEVGLRRRSA